MSGQGSDSRTSIGDTIEETFMAAILGIMTLVTFANVVARYIFNSNILWALETTVFLFAWLVLIGASYGIKKHFHIGVDVVVNMLPARARKDLLTGGCLLLCGICRADAERCVGLLVAVHWPAGVLRNRRRADAVLSAIPCRLAE